MTTAKRCKTCHESKPPTEFHRMKANKDGLHNACKVCRRKVEQSRSATKRKDPAYAERDRVRNREYARERRKADPVGVNEYQRQWRAANPGKSAEYTRKSYYKHHDKSLERSRTRYRLNPGYFRNWASANRDKVNGYARKWHEANPYKTAEYNNSRRALKLNATTDGPVDYAAIYAAHDVCYLCGGALVNPVHMDHVIPLSRGGAHSVGNLLPAHARCNLRKHDALLSELSWYRGPVDLGATSATDE